jgi:integral membrane sensor domain MASE1
MNSILTILLVAALALLAGAYYLWRKGAPRRQVVLMAVLAAIMLANVAIWTLPYANGEAPIDKADALGE